MWRKLAPCSEPASPELFLLYQLFTRLKGLLFIVVPGLPDGTGLPIRPHSRIKAQGPKSVCVMIIR
jgi:hypothetical protein